MKKTKFTRGPWAVNPIRAQVDAMPSMIPVCQLLWPTDERTESETEANAHLISAAPDLYDALAELLDSVDGVPCGPEKICRAALAKARGEI